MPGGSGPSSHRDSGQLLAGVMAWVLVVNALASLLGQAYADLIRPAGSRTWSFPVVGDGSDRRGQRRSPAPSHAAAVPAPGRSAVHSASRSFRLGRLLPRQRDQVGHCTAGRLREPIPARHSRHRPPRRGDLDARHYAAGVAPGAGRPPARSAMAGRTPGARSPTSGSRWSVSRLRPPSSPCRTGCCWPPRVLSSTSGRRTTLGSPLPRSSGF